MFIRRVEIHAPPVPLPDWRLGRSYARKYSNSKLFNEFQDAVGDVTNFVDIFHSAKLVAYRTPGAIVLCTSLLAFLLSVCSSLPWPSYLPSELSRGHLMGSANFSL